MKDKPSPTLHLNQRTKIRKPNKQPRTETDSDIEVRVPLPPGTAAKSIQLSVTKTSITLGLKGREGPVLKVIFVHSAAAFR